MAKNGKEFSEERLDNSKVSIQNLTVTNYMHGVLLSWKVRNYSKLLNNVIYCKSICTFDCDWKLKLTKAKGILFLSLYTNLSNLVVMFIINIYDDNEESQRMQTLSKEIGNNLYVAEFCNRCILDPQKNCLEEDVLLIGCLCLPDSGFISQDTAPDGELNDRSNGIELCKNLKTLFLKQIHPDFEIKIKNALPTKVHKLILRARSKYINDLLTEEEANDIFRTEISVSVHPAILWGVLMYIYSAEIEDMTVESMIDVFKLANQWIIEPLVKKCVTFLSMHITQENARAIFAVAQEHNEVELKNAVARFWYGKREYIA